MKIRQFKYSNDEIHYLYNCPGCGYEHAFDPLIHEFNGDFNKPTISPSLLHVSSRRCHSYIVDGRIKFLADCWHQLAGQTVDLIDYAPEKEDSNEIIDQG